MLALFVLVPVLALAGCQKSGDSTQPAAAVNGPGSEKPDAHVPATAEAAAPKSDHDSHHPIYEFETSQGKFTVRLDAEKAPQTVENFHNYVARGHYDLTIFHQVLKDPQVVIGGGYTADLNEKPSFTPILNEAHNGLKNRRGTIGMARRPNDEDSATCQFFFNIADNDGLNHKARTPADYGYCVFGEVTDGMDVLDRIAQAPVHDFKNFANLPVETIVIKTVRQIK
jgi:cyclophilin family peptidyl-prolyl cis-trans isomerase/predicted small lipoprotein YifL